MVGMEYRRRILEMWASELAKLNITLNINQMLFEAMYAQSQEEDKTKIQHIFTFANWPDIVHPGAMYSNSAHSSGAWDFSYYWNEEYDAMIDDAFLTSVIDFEAGRAKYLELAEYTAEQAMFINMGDDKSVTVINKRVKGLNPNPAYEWMPFFYYMWLED
jgi:peptide/nickel transport system substrate-binding protein